MARKQLTLRLGEHYVYVLVDPRDGKPFYVGKGKNKRCKAHVAEWRSGKAQNQRKAAKIEEIVRSGNEVKVEILKDGLTEAFALIHEKATIAELRAQGADLTNLSSGMRHQLEIGFAQVQTALGRYPNKRRFKISMLYWKDREPTKDEYWSWIRGLEELANLRKRLRAGLIEQLGEEEAMNVAAMYGYPR